ncbi:MAG: histidine ammonia-lyase, partial [Deltaproteobacteria bacterium]|nr:histidine ammonia-lyase [Deltaproteobacteria bacterium]
AWGRGTREAYRVIRKHVTYLEKDRELGKDIENMVALIQTGSIIDAAEKAIGELNLL